MKKDRKPYSIEVIVLGGSFVILLINMLAVPFYIFGGLRWGISASSVLTFLMLIGLIKAIDKGEEEKHE